MSSPINRLAASFERRERDSGDWERRQRKKSGIGCVRVSVFSCINFWGVEKAKLGQGEQRTGFFFFRSSSDCIVHIQCFRIDKQSDGLFYFNELIKNLKAREAIYLSLSQLCSILKSVMTWVKEWSPTPSVASLHDNACM